MDLSTLVSHRDFTNLSLKSPQTDDFQSLYDCEPPDYPKASHLDTKPYDDVHPSADETVTFEPDAAADSFVSEVVNPDHNRYAETADDVSGTQFTTEQTAAHKEFVNTALSVFGPLLQKSLQQCMKDCVAASTQAAQEVINANKPRVQESVVQSDNNSAACYLSPPPSLDDHNLTSRYDSEHEPTIFETPSYKSDVFIPASQLLSSSSARTDIARKKARRKARRKRKAKAAERNLTRATSGRETQATREFDFQTRRAALEFDFATKKAAREFDWDTREAARDAANLDFVNRVADRKREELKRTEARLQRLALRAERTGQNTRSDGTYDAPRHMITHRVTDNGVVLKDTVDFHH